MIDINNCISNAFYKTSQNFAIKRGSLFDIILNDNS